MVRKILEEWEEKVLSRFLSSSIKKVDVRRASATFRYLFPPEYFEVKVKEISDAGNIQNPVTGTSKLVFLLCQFEEGAISHIIEIGKVLHFFSEPEYKRYLNSKLYAKGGIKPGFFEGEYFEIYVCYILLTNGMNVSLDENDPTVDGKKPLDALVKIGGENYLVECKQLSSIERFLQAQELTFFINLEWTKRVKKILVGDLMGLEQLAICGYCQLDKDISRTKNQFSKLLRKALHCLVRGEAFTSISDPSLAGNVFIEKWEEDKYKSYQSVGDKTLVKFEFSPAGMRSSLEIPDPTESVVQKIKKKGISLKKRQHKDSGIKNKIIFLGFENGYQALPPLTRDFFTKNRIRFLEKVDDNLMVCFLVKNFFGRRSYSTDIYTLAIDQAQIENLMQELPW